MDKEDLDEVKYVGVCRKSADGVVLYQNSICLKLCGDELGQSCRKGCMAKYSNTIGDGEFKLGLSHLKNVGTDGRRFVDGIIINDGTHLTTILVDKTDIVERQLRTIQRFGLTKSETQIMELLFQGFANKEISAKLFISKSTLKTHLNNIYRKLPENIRRTIQALHAA